MSRIPENPELLSEPPMELELKLYRKLEDPLKDKESIARNFQEKTEFYRKGINNPINNELEVSNSGSLSLLSKSTYSIHEFRGKFKKKRKNL